MQSQWKPSEIDGDSAAGLGTCVGRWGAAENARHVLCCESDEDRGRRRLVEDWWRIGVGLVDSWSPVDGSTHKWTNTGWNMMKSGLNDELAICDFWSLVDWFGNYDHALPWFDYEEYGDIGDEWWPVASWWVGGLYQPRLVGSYHSPWMGNSYQPTRG